MLNPLFALSFQAARFGWEMQSVIALRLMRLAGGGASAHSEARRIGTEKMAALAEAQTSATTVAIKGAMALKSRRKLCTVIKSECAGTSEGSLGDRALR
jgi:hypothetical protein